MSEITDSEVFEFLFTESDSYFIIPQMLEKTSNDVSESKYDCVKEFSITHHISGMIDIVLSVSKCIDKLNKEATILGINLEDCMDEEQYQKFNKIRQFLENL